MATTLSSAKLEAVLAELRQGAAGDDAVDRPALPAGRSSWSEVTAAERADAYAGHYLPISDAAGRLLYGLVRAVRPAKVVEFGMSYGISTLYLAAAVTDNGVGEVVTTELNAAKVVAASASLQAAGVADVVTVLAGDALDTLAAVGGPVGLALLDGWKELCLPVLRLLEPKLADGALVAADDSTFPSMADYLTYVRDPANGYVTVEFPVEDGLELSCWTGRRAGG